MKTQALVSIIVPCYNYGHLLHETINSILAQTYQNWECIIVDDGSTDHSRDVALEFVNKDKRIVYIRQDNKGLSSARNTGLKSAKGTYIQFLDADDLLSATKLEAQLKVFDTDPEIDIVYGDVCLFENGKNHISESVNFFLGNAPVTGRNEIILQAIVEDNFFLVHCPLVKREKVIALRFEEDLKAFEDWNYWYKCALLGCNFYYLKEKSNIVYVRGHGNNMSKDRCRMWSSKIISRRKLIRYTQQLSLEGLLKINSNIADYINNKHKECLYLDLQRYHLMFGNIFLGLGAMLQYALHSGKYYFALYDAAYWIKERLKLSI